jgi:hypothetical protein
VGDRGWDGAIGTRRVGEVGDRGWDEAIGTRRVGDEASGGRGEWETRRVGEEASGRWRVSGTDRVERQREDAERESGKCYGAVGRTEWDDNGKMPNVRVGNVAAENAKRQRLMATVGSGDAEYVGNSTFRDLKY